MHKNKGFTLIEMMIVIAIVGVLASIAYVSYSGQLIKSNRVSAALELREAAYAMEIYRSDEGVYPEKLSDVLDEESLHIGNGHYLLSLDKAASSRNTFKLVAAPVDRQKKSPCGTLYITSDETKGVENLPDWSTKVANECWG